MGILLSSFSGLASPFNFSAAGGGDAVSSPNDAGNSKELELRFIRFSGDFLPGSDSGACSGNLAMKESGSAPLVLLYVKISMASFANKSKCWAASTQSLHSKGMFMTCIVHMSNTLNERGSATLSQASQQTHPPLHFFGRMDIVAERKPDVDLEHCMMHKLELVAEILDQFTQRQILEVFVHELLAAAEPQCPPFVALMSHGQDDVAVHGSARDGLEADREPLEVRSACREVGRQENSFKALNRQDFVDNVFRRGNDAFKTAVLVHVKVLGASVVVSAIKDTRKEPSRR